MQSAQQQQPQQQKKPTSETPRQEQQKFESPYADIPGEPTMEAVEGIKFDFNHGLRVSVPNNGVSYHLTFIDLDSHVVLFSGDAKDGVTVASVKKYFIRFKLIIFHTGDPKPIFEHEYNAKDQQVLIQVPGGTVGDTVGWFSYVERFQQKHQCKVICVMQPWLSEMFKDQYPEITFVSKAEAKQYKTYATYFMGLFFRGDVDNQPMDFRYIGLHRTAGCILGVGIEDIPPRVNLSAPRQIKEPYVVIATQASSQAKYWNNPFGWRMVLQFLHQNGYKVVCIDRDPVYGTGLAWNHIPFGVDIDDTGGKPMQERIDMIKDADFFIGLSSGLSWVAWCCKVPVVMISGFTNYYNEYITPYRVFNHIACNSCWNDMRENFDHNNFLWCPRHANDDRQFECTKLITPEQVIDTIKTIPAFQKQAKKYAKEHPSAEESNKEESK